MCKKIYVTEYSSPIGVITLGSSGKSLIGLWIEGQKYFLSKYKQTQDDDTIEIFEQTKTWLSEYFKGNNPEISIPLEPVGTEFQKKVWEELKNIPYGMTVTYGDISEKLHIGSAQAVGGAVGQNPISIIIPCHRVVGKNGNLTGYAGGIDKKSMLLNMEKSSLIV